MRARLSEGSLFEKSSAKTFLLSPTALAVRQEPNPLGLSSAQECGYFRSFRQGRSSALSLPPTVYGVSINAPTLP